MYRTEYNTRHLPSLYAGAASRKQDTLKTLKKKLKTLFHYEYFNKNKNIYYAETKSKCEMCLWFW